MADEAHFSLIWKSVFPCFWLGALLAVSNQQLNFCNWKSPQSSAAGSQTSPSQVLQSNSQHCHTHLSKLLHGYQVENHQNTLQQNSKPVLVRFSNSKCVRGSDYMHLPIFVHLASLLFGLLGHSDYKSEFCISIRAKLSWKDHFEVLGEMQYISANSERN